MMLLLVTVVSIMLYCWYGIRTSHSTRLRNWPISRYVLFAAGICSISVALSFHAQSHHNFQVHMFVHLLLGMLAPLLLVLSAPVTLLLRALPVSFARFLTRLLRLRFVSIVTNPFVAMLLNFGGLWILYQTILFEWMHTFFIVNVAVHVHLFIAGFVFTSSVLYIDPVPHRFSFRFRALVMIIGFTLHSILSKIIYSASLPGVPLADAKQGAVFMYYGGDLIDACLIGVFCFQWYRKSMVHVPLNESLSNT
ncbi:cytochrome c oxidase assembly protein [Geomicrobium sediminis]|uniref:Membrane protein n=1 Tax=Geomicrobium sediminis TaxID=1347788 RepID=A0ABS2PAY7_9BACL|nr:cytochrome c oxidase assembly protein [Geomicrobium sediminis]MBM7632296.1 putative membrane protein [Geomicrobium sediminis]